MDLFYGDFLASIRVFCGPLSLLFFVIRHLEVAILFVSIRVHLSRRSLVRRRIRLPRRSYIA
jgi:hypothetical protein